jgi:hypothetical protein
MPFHQRSERRWITLVYKLVKELIVLQGGGIRLDHLADLVQEKRGTGHCLVLVGMVNHLMIVLAKTGRVPVFLEKMKVST